MRKSLISLMFALLCIPCASAKETTDNIEDLQWHYDAGVDYNLGYEYFYYLSWPLLAQLGQLFKKLV